MQRSIKMLGAAALLATALSAGVAANAQTASSAPVTTGSGTPTSSSTTTTATPRDDGQGFANIEDRRFNHLTKALDLNADQQTKLKSILDNAETQRKALHDNKGTSRADRRAQMKSIQDNTHSSISAILTPDQSKKFETMMTRAKDGMAGGFGRHRANQSTAGTGSADTSSTGAPADSGSGDADNDE